MAKVEVRNLFKSFSGTKAVDDLNFVAEDGVFLTFLGPSGCGKTTTLRCIAGLELPDAGEIDIGDRVVFRSGDGGFVNVPTHKRKVSMVFQSYALWPHLTVFENIAFPLRLRKVPRKEVESRVEKVCCSMNLEGLEKRYPAQLSGGQQQRVALCRSIVYDSDVLLFDEPLSNLDAKLREQARFELRDLQKRLKVTTIYVTHNQAEALTMSDLVVLMNEGKSIQQSTPVELYETPIDEFAADFIGAVNIFSGNVAEILPKRKAIINTQESLTVHCFSQEEIRVGDKVKAMFRPEDILIVPESQKGEHNVWECEVKEKSYLGDHILYLVLLGEKQIRMKSNKNISLEKGKAIYVKVEPEMVYILPG